MLKYTLVKDFYKLFASFSSALEQGPCYFKLQTQIIWEILLYERRDYICKKIIVSVEFIYNTNFRLKNESDFIVWIKEIAKSESFSVGNLNYAFFDDDGLKHLNKKFLHHDYYTDVISFNDSKGPVINGDIAISVDRVKENAIKYNTSFEKETLRVMAHGLLHLMGFDDKTETERNAMQSAENIKIKMFHVEH